jgi:hypothetical protein
MMASAEFAELHFVAVFPQRTHENATVFHQTRVSLSPVFPDKLSQIALSAESGYFENLELIRDAAE